MPIATRDQPAPPRHEGLLTSSLNPREDRVDAWVHSAVDHGYKIFSLGAALDRQVIAKQPGATVTAIDIGDLHPFADPVQLVQRTLDEGFAGLSILVRADSVIAATSSDVHTVIETELADLCDHHPVSVLCCYDRDGAGTDHLDMAVAHHNDGLHEQQLSLRRIGDTVQLSGEVDLNNLDVLVAALKATTQAGPSTVRIDVNHAQFLSAGAAQALGHHTASFRDHGGHVELRGVNPHIARILQLLQLHPLRGLELIPNS